MIMPLDHLILLVVGAIGLAGGLLLLHEAKKYRKCQRNKKRRSDDE
jgi:hypothetical protein